jgi:hypothetical protein
MHSVSSFIFQPHFQRSQNAGFVTLWRLRWDCSVFFSLPAFANTERRTELRGDSDAAAVMKAPDTRL